MKKVIALLMAFAMLFCFAACGEEKITPKSNEDNTVVENAKTESADATKEEVKEEEVVEEEPVEETVPESWTKSFYVDDFNEPTDEWFISTELVGTFCNSATNDSSLTGYVLIDAEDVSFILYEYNRNQVKNIFSKDEEYTITARPSNGAEAKFVGYIYSEGDRIVVRDSDTAAITNLLKTGGDIKFYIYETDNSVTNYLFKVSSDNLASLLQ